MEILSSSSVEKFIKECPPETVAKILRTIDLLQEFGFKLGMPHVKLVMRDIYELRISGKQNIRIFYTFLGSKAVLFHAILKKSRKLSRKDASVIERRFKEL